MAERKEIHVGPAGDATPPGGPEWGQADDDALPNEPMKINLGPSHPAMHGVVRMIATLDGERIRDIDIDIGYLHRGFEKEAEYATWAQIFPYTDRLNYVSPILNNIGYAMAVEKLLGLTGRIPERAQYIRVITGEVARIADHLTCQAASVMELGAYTPFLWLTKSRNWLYDALEEISGARITNSFVRVGGVLGDMPPGWGDKLLQRMDDTLKTVEDTEALVSKNRIFRDRMEGIGILSREEAIADGWTGPPLRSTGVDYDVRKDHPYLVYDRLEFDVPVGTRGDNYDRFNVRMYEIRQSMRIIRQALRDIPPGAIYVDDPRVVLPPKAETYNTIEGMIRHFKLVMDGIRVPAGEVYSYSEAGNGELGYYIVSDGTGRPYRCRVRAPSFATFQSFPKQVKGFLISDITPTFGQVNYIAGETER